jgi:polysaccharide export outer membrane protein
MRVNVPLLEKFRASTRSSWLFAPWCIALVLMTAGCAGAGQYVWYGELPSGERSTAAGDYVIGVGDQISIRVYEQEGLSGDVKIRRDGKIAMPLVGEVMVAGKRPLQLSRELEGLLKQFVVTPRVTINVVSSAPISVTVLGEASHIGVLTLEPPARLVEALAQAGGPGEFADKSRIFVLRQFPAYKRIRFKWDDVLRNEQGAAAFPLLTGDVIVIE